ncbi:MAG: RNA methyltransferase [Bryobacteraceae bacterium]|jgi:TrmH family RNA methyltransferase
MAKSATVVSAANPLLKDVRRAIARGGLTRQGWCVAETFHLLDEALRSGCEVKMVLAAESARSAAESHVQHLPGVKVAVLPDALFQGISDTETSQGVMALVNPPAWRIDQLFRGKALVVVLDGLQDPGNAGAILRAAEAFGATGAIFLKGTVSPYNPKTLRASAGSLFRVPYVHGVDAELARAALRQNQVALYAGVPAPGVLASGVLASHNGTVRWLANVDLTGKCGLIIGNEARGVGAQLRSAALDVSIPTVGVESLNAAMAAGIMLYEARRQRAQSGEGPG